MVNSKWRVRIAYRTRVRDEVMKIQERFGNRDMTVNKECTVVVDEKRMRELRELEREGKIWVRDNGK